MPASCIEAESGVPRLALLAAAAEAKYWQTASEADSSSSMENKALRKNKQYKYNNVLTLNKIQ